MQNKSFAELEKEYDLEINRIVKTIGREKAKKILLQFPDGLKPYSDVIAREIENKLKNGAEILIWFGSCFGACDVPLQAENLGVDLIVQFGHSVWKYNKKKGIKVL